MMGGRGPGMIGGYWDTGTYLDALKSQLNIPPQQEPACKQYADTVSGISEQMQRLHQTMFESMGTASWNERRNMMDQMFDARQKAYDTVHDAANKLLSALDQAHKAKSAIDPSGTCVRSRHDGQALRWSRRREERHSARQPVVSRSCGAIGHISPLTPSRIAVAARDKIEAQLAAIKRMPGLVRSFFHAPTVAYITD